MSDTDRLQFLVDELRRGASQFSDAARTIQTGTNQLTWATTSLLSGSDGWSGFASQAFQNIWNAYQSNAQHAINALYDTASALSKLAQKIDTTLQTRRIAELQVNAILLAASGLTLLDVMQGGIDPLSDLATAGTLAEYEMLMREIQEATVLLDQADIEASTELDQIILPLFVEVSGEGWSTGSTLYPLTGTNASTDYSNPLSATFEDPTNPIAGTDGEAVGVPSDSEAGREEPGESISFDSGETSISVDASMWSEEKEQQIGSFYDTPVTQSGELKLGNAEAGIGMQSDEIGLEGEASLLEASSGWRVGSKDLGWTSGLDTEVMGAEGNLDLKDDGSLDADIGFDLISDTGSTGVDIGGTNIGVDATIGLKAELGIEIGTETEIKLPFISFGFSIGDAK